jgi:hypothetical protein
MAHKMNGAGAKTTNECDEVIGVLHEAELPIALPWLWVVASQADRYCSVLLGDWLHLSAEVAVVDTAPVNEYDGNTSPLLDVCQVIAIDRGCLRSVR